MLSKGKDRRPAREAELELALGQFGRDNSFRNEHFELKSQSKSSH